jgi:hypothetical protein
MEAADGQERENAGSLIKIIGLIRQVCPIAKKEGRQDRSDLNGGGKRERQLLPVDFHGRKLLHPMIPQGKQQV